MYDGKLKFHQCYILYTSKLLTLFNIGLGNMVRDDGGHVDANNHSNMDHRSNRLEEGGNTSVTKITFSDP